MAIIIKTIMDSLLLGQAISICKYRAWATTGRCHGGYCLPKIAQMLVEDYGLAPEEVTYRGAGSPLFTGRVKE